MAKEIITRKASDNSYFHKDFHIAFNYALDYLYNNFGKQAVKEYLKQFAESYYSLLKKSLVEKGLLALKEHYENIFNIEDAEYNIELSSDEMNIHLLASPAVIYIKKNGHTVSPVFNETILTVNKEICNNTPYECEVTEYNFQNGGYRLRFFRRTK